MICIWQGHYCRVCAMEDERLGGIIKHKMGVSLIENFTRSIEPL